MNANGINLLPVPKKPEPISWGHISTIAGTLALLLFFTWIKNPSAFAFHKAPALAADDPSVPHYYAYVPPASDNVPMVAGASTQDEGPSIINEDGSISPVADSGAVLGVSTDQLNLSLDGIAVTKQIADSPEAIQKYFNDTDAVEASSINNTDFESALASGNQSQIDGQIAKMKDVVAQLEKLDVPRAAVQLQKNKILQYDAAITILQYYTKADDNAELVSQALGVFLQAQDNIANEISKLQTQFNVTSNDASNQ